MIERILNVILDMKSFESLAEKIHQYKIKLRTKAISEIPNLKKKLTKIDSKINNIVNAIAEGIIKPHLAKETLEKLELDKDFIQEEIDRENLI